LLSDCCLVFHCRCQQTFSIKSQTVNALGFVGHLVSVVSTQHCHYSSEAARDKYKGAWLCSSKTLFIKTGGGLDLALGPYFADFCSLLFVSFNPFFLLVLEVRHSDITFFWLLVQFDHAYLKTKINNLTPTPTSLPDTQT